MPVPPGARRLWLALALAVLGPHAATAAPRVAAAHAADVVVLAQAQVVARVDGQAPGPREKRALPYRWDRHHGMQSGQADLSLAFALAAPPQEPYGVYIPSIGSSAALWLNGSLLVRWGDTAQRGAADFSKAPRYVALPPGLLARDNVLHIELQADPGRRSGLSRVTLGPAAQVQPLFERVHDRRVNVSLAVVVFSLLVGGVALLLWLTQTVRADGRRGRDAVYLFAALAEFSWALRVVDVAIDDPPLPWNLWIVVVTVAFAGWFCGNAMFCHAVAGWNRLGWTAWFRGWVALLFVGSAAAATATVRLATPLPMTVWLGLVNVSFAVYALVYFTGALRRPNREHLLVAVAGMVNLAVGVRDWYVVRIVGDLESGTWIGYSSVLFGLVLGSIVIARFRAASAEASDLGANLAARVAEREDALRQSYARVDALVREQARTGERTRILRDLHDSVGTHISAAIRQLESGCAASGEVLATLRTSLDQLKLSIDAMHLPPGDVVALLANVRYRLAPRLEAAGIALEWDVDELPLQPQLDAVALRGLQFLVFEALSSGLQQAGVRLVRVVARAGSGGVVLSVENDGDGRPPAATPELARLQAQAAALGAMLHFETGLGRNVLHIPLP